MNNKVLVLNWLCNFAIWDGVDSVDAVKCYRSTSLFNRVMRRSSITVGCSLDSSWKRSLADYSCVLIPDSTATNGLLKWLVRYSPVGQRRVLLLRNRVDSISHFSINLARKLNYEILSYSREDCAKYGFSHHKQFLNRRLSAYKDDHFVYDAAFLGWVKDRGETIRDIKNMLDSQGFRTWFSVPGMDGLPGNMASGEEEIDYSDYLKVIGHTKAVVDIVSPSNYGMTLRPLEALFTERKLITNYSDIKNEEFYHPDNIYVIGEDDDIIEFMNRPYRKIDGSVTEKYTADYLIRHIMRMDNSSED